MEVSKSGSAASLNQIGTVSANAGSVVADGTYVYWLDVSGNSGTLYRQLEGVSGELAPEQVGPTLDCPATLAQDEGHLYYSAGCPPDIKVFQIAKP